jgi:hypothetical protein
LVDPRGRALATLCVMAVNVARSISKTASSEGIATTFILF